MRLKRLQKQTREEKKRYLSSYLTLKYEVEREAEDAGYWREKAYSISSINLYNLGISSNNSHFQPIDKFLDLAQHCADLGEEAQAKKDEIRKAIEELDHQQYRLVLSMYYLDGYKLADIAKKLKYTIGHITKLHRQAVDAFNIPKRG